MLILNLSDTRLLTASMWGDTDLPPRQNLSQSPLGGADSHLSWAGERWLRRSFFVFNFATGTAKRGKRSPWARGGGEGTGMTCLVANFATGRARKRWRSYCNPNYTAPIQAAGLWRAPGSSRHRPPGPDLLDVHGHIQLHPLLCLLLLGIALIAKM
jgi:hypothetical protein